MIKNILNLKKILLKNNILNHKNIKKEKIL